MHKGVNKGAEIDEEDGGRALYGGDMVALKDALKDVSERLANHVLCFFFLDVLSLSLDLYYS